ncbi:MAG: phospho-sugar mutase [Opitutales bacterium]
MNLLQAIQQAVDNHNLSSSAQSNLQMWLEAEELPDWTRSSLTELIQGEEWEELNDRFYKDITFGTGGMRGRTIGKVMTSAEKGGAGKEDTPERPMVGSNALNDYTLLRATMALFNYVKHFLEEEGRFETPKLVIAHDVRHFSRRFCLLAASLWNRLGGISLIFDGPRSTPHLSFTVRRRRAHAGIVITASHNPPHDNGFKAYFEDGAQVVSPQAEGIVEEYGRSTLQEIVQYLDIDENGIRVLPQNDDLAYLKVVEQAAIDPDIIQKEKPKVVFTPIHGTGAISSVPALWELGLEPIVVDEQNKQDPRFPTVKSPNPEDPEALEQGISLARKTGAVAVIATDPDGDRMGVATVDERRKYVLLNGNQIGALLAEYRINRLKELGCLPENGTKSAIIIKTFVTTPLVDAIASGQGLQCVNTLTGFKWTGQKIRQYEENLKKEFYQQEGIAIDYDNTDYYSRIDLGIKYGKSFLFACEESYGYLPYDFVRDKDANASTVAFCELISFLSSNKESIIEYLDSIYLKYGYYDQKTISVYFDGESGANKIKNILKSYKDSPPAHIGDIRVRSHMDFNEAGYKDEDGDPIPIEDFHIFKLDNDYSFAVRASGTEPKIKFYVFGKASANNQQDLQNEKLNVLKNLDLLAQTIETDAKIRANE